MSKKELKERINNKGFFLQIDNVEKLEKNAIATLGGSNAIKTKAKLPEGENIFVFKGLASQAFEVGEESRNGYKIDPDGWDWSAYKNNPAILLQHNDDAPIGKTLEINKTDKGIEILYYVDKNALTKEDAYRVENGLFSGLSTGHITKAVMYENAETGERIDEQTFIQMLMVDESVWDSWIKVVTEAEAVEISVVSLPSNPEALTVQNSLKHYFTNRLENMKKVKNEVEAPEQEAETTEAPAEAEETKEAPAETKEEAKEEQPEAPAEEKTDEDNNTEETPEEEAETKGETPEGEDEPKAENDAEGEDEPADAETGEETEEAEAQPNAITEDVFVEAMGEVSKTLNSFEARLAKLEGKNSKPIRKGLVVAQGIEQDLFKTDEKKEVDKAPEKKPNSFLMNSIKRVNKSAQKNY